ncbi:MAG: hypothetical protein COA45_03940 [Zetaproteobacteria bacterium]|nr:MAG: hypothetical protein COA45_03940 [Zetaproteobacteria bacterium]
MSRTTDWIIENFEEQYTEERTKWIRDELNDLDADEYTEGWHRLEQEYDDAYEINLIYQEEEWQWFHSQNHSDFYISFAQTISELKTILSSRIDDAVVHTVYKMAYVHAVTAMETYLSDSLKSTVLANKSYIANAAKNLKELKNKNFKLEQFLLESASVDKIVLGQLRKYLYHDVVRVMEIYKATLGFQCSHDLGDLIKITSMRHDIVHRNGKDNDGTPVHLNLTDLNMSIDKIESFVKYLDDSLRDHHEV